MKLDPEQARDHILQGNKRAIETDGLLDLSNTDIQEISCPVICQNLDATGAKLKNLRSDVEIRARLILDDCRDLTSLPSGLNCGAISLRNCICLNHLPEDFNTWFLDMTGCSRFTRWPKNGKVERGILRLRNCIELQSLPGWLDCLAQLDLAGCVQLRSIPPTVRISGWIDVGGTEIRSLPDSMSEVPIRWRGVPVPRRIAFEPESISAKEILDEPNAELRRVMIERMGYLEFSKDAGAKLIDKDTDQGGERQLLRIELPDDEPLVGISCFCPSTKRQYFLRVPPNMKSCHQAVAWMAGFDDPKLYKPIIET